MEAATLNTVQVDGLTIGYRQLGEGSPVLLLHGWPTSSYLWRDVMPEGFEGLDELIDSFAAPFDTPEARRALADAGVGLDLEGFAEIEQRLPQLSIPVRIVYGEEDRALPDVAATMARVKGDLPQAEVTALPGRGHFIQEEVPDQVGELLADFFAAGDATAAP